MTGEHVFCSAFWSFLYLFPLTQFYRRVYIHNIQASVPYTETFLEKLFFFLPKTVFLFLFSFNVTITFIIILAETPCAPPSPCCDHPCSVSAEPLFSVLNTPAPFQAHLYRTGFLLPSHFRLTARVLKRHFCCCLPRSSGGFSLSLFMVVSTEPHFVVCSKKMFFLE